MEIQLSQIAKRFRYEWIFKGIDVRIKSGEKYAILGSNGSGKSTLMKIICGHLSPSQGEISYLLEEKAITRDSIYNYVSYAAPYIGLVEEFTLAEMIRFHFQFNERFAALTDKELIERLNFSKSARHQAIQFFSSGMKQRLKLLLACCSTNPILLLDEPTTNLDKQGFQWYHGLIEEFAKEKTVIVATNEERDYSFCNHQINIQNFKPA